MNFDDRKYQIRGSAVGTAIDPFENPLGAALDPEVKYGTGGRLSLRKAGGKVRGGVYALWEHDKLDPNDMGFLSAPDEKVVSGDVTWQYDADNAESSFNRVQITLDGYRTWLYAGNAGTGVTGDQKVWRYGAGHHQSSGAHLNIWGQHRNFHQGWILIGRACEGTDKYATRTYDDRRGPLMTRAGRWAISAGGTTDWRKPLSLHLEGWYDHDDHGLRTYNFAANLRWNQSGQLLHQIGLSVQRREDPDKWLDNFANDGSQPGVAGIGGVDYVFAELDQTTWDVTLRTSLLFDRDRSLQLYLQPFLTYGDYSVPRWLAAPDSHDLRPYDGDASSYDFNFGAVNLNLVYRWEYRPGSTIYLVWSHSKNRYEQRGSMSDPAGWNNDFKPGYPFAVEPGNTFLAKFSYWFSI